MTNTDKIISNIGAIRTMLENFPMGLFDKNGKTYTSAFDFMMDLLKCCGITDTQILTYILGKLYGFEGQPGYTIEGLYEGIKRSDIQIEQNEFINALEYSIKTILMALFTSIYTCSALPVFPNKVFDYDDMENLMSNTVRDITIQNSNNDYAYKLKIPIQTIDIFDMLSISPATSKGSLYYMVDGHDKYYHKEMATSSYTRTVTKHLNVGDTYKDKIYKFTDVYELGMTISTNNGCNISYSLYSRGSLIPTQSPIRLDITTTYLEAGFDAPKSSTLTIDEGEMFTSSYFFVIPQEDESKAVIQNIIINGHSGGVEVGDTDGDKIWIYLCEDASDLSLWESEGGKQINSAIFGEDRYDEKVLADVVCEIEQDYQCEESAETQYMTYRLMNGIYKSTPKDAVRYSYVPNSYAINEQSPDYIVCYEGVPANLLYKTNDMNAFIWYCLNRGNSSNQTEQNHLMWDNRVSAAKNGIARSSAEDWNAWYDTKNAEGKEFKYVNDINGLNETIFPIVQIEKYTSTTILLRIPSQKYFAPKKREDLINGTFYDHPNRSYFNASVYKFDWDYLKNITILNPKLLLVRLVEHLLGFTMDVASNTKFDLTRKKVELVLSKAVKSIIEANDMEVEDCWKSFSNEDFNDLLNELLLSRYTASEYNGEVARTRQHDINDYLNSINDINSSAQSQGTTTKITKMITDVMVTPGVEPSTDWEFEFKFDSKMLEKLIWAMVMPIIESIFTPQVMLLMMINFQLLGIVNIDEALGQDFGKIINLLINKILGLVKSIILFIKDKIIQMLLDLFNEYIMPLLKNYAMILLLEHISDWLVILLEAVKCLPNLIMPVFNKPIGYIEEVDYADIVTEQNIPENSSEC